MEWICRYISLMLWVCSNVESCTYFYTDNAFNRKKAVQCDGGASCQVFLLSVIFPAISGERDASFSPFMRGIVWITQSGELFSRFWRNYENASGFFFSTEMGLGPTWKKRTEWKLYVYFVHNLVSASCVIYGFTCKILLLRNLFSFLGPFSGMECRQT